MTRIKRRLLIGGAIVLFGFLALGAIVFVPTRNALQRAEAFHFRRMSVTSMDEEHAYRFFFVTNRRMESPEGPAVERFGRERGDALTFGFFDTQIEPTLGLGMLFDPTKWLQNEQIQLREVQFVDRAPFVGEIRTLVKKSPHRSLLVVVHGFKEALESGMRKTAFLMHVLDIDSPMLFFDWPGNQGSTPRGYRRARDIAKASGAELAETLELIIREIRPDKLWLVANSMGGQVVNHAFHRLYQNPDLADGEYEIEDVVLTAPDVGRDEFNEQFKREIAALTRNLTVYVSSNDRALVLSRIINRARRMGESTLNIRNPDQSDEAAAVAQLVEPDSELITLVDVTPVNRTRNFHNFSLETPEFFDDLYLRLTNTPTPENRLIYPFRTGEGRTYWVLTRGR